MQKKDLKEQNSYLRNELMDVEHSNAILRQENDDLRLRNQILWRLVKELRDLMEEQSLEDIETF